jgi:putative SOS response-associated peptidase YedK
MCGRYTIRLLQPIIDMFGFPLSADFPPDFPARYNVAPTEDVPVVRVAQQPESKESAIRTLGATDSAKPLRLDLLHWGLVPSWAEDPSIGNRMINARAETAASKPAFRDAMRRRRCLVPADGFYEWRKLGDAAGGSVAGTDVSAAAAEPKPAKGKKPVRKQPYLFRMKNDRPFAFGGLWDTWWRDGKKLESFTILTTSPNALVAPVHDRMPVIVAAADYARWLDPARNAADVQDLLRPYDAAEMEAVPVGKHVNSPANDDARCVEKEDAWE